MCFIEAKHVFKILCVKENFSALKYVFDSLMDIDKLYRRQIRKEKERQREREKFPAQLFRIHHEIIHATK